MEWDGGTGRGDGDKDGLVVVTGEGEDGLDDWKCGLCGLVGDGPEINKGSVEISPPCVSVG